MAEWGLCGRQEVMPESKEAELERGKALMAGDSLITRFCLYGFLKNLKFFEPCAAPEPAGPLLDPPPLAAHQHLDARARAVHRAGTCGWCW